MTNDTRQHRIAELEALLEKRIVFLDGAMGTMLQSYGLEESDYRGKRFKSWPRSLMGNKQVLGNPCCRIVR